MIRVSMTDLWSVTYLSKFLNLFLVTLFVTNFKQTTAFSLCVFVSLV